MTHDIAIIGAGIAGASLAAALAPHMRVLLLEAEEQPGYHSTGRSNALWHETYGGPMVQPLTTASKPHFDRSGFLKARPTITLGRDSDVEEIQSFIADFADQPVDLELMDRTGLERLVPGLRPEWTNGALEQNSFDIDVAGLHAGYLAAARHGGAQLSTRAGLISAKWSGRQWALETGNGSFSAALLVNAAGGWADAVARLCGARPLAITPYRRTITQLRLARDVDPDLPFVIDVKGGFYFRPEGARRVWLSPQDETAVIASDVAPEELDIAIAIDRFEKVVDWPVVAVERSWAGLRSFAPDRLPVYGFDGDCPGFFWCAGQGGFGIQTAPAAAALCAALITGQRPESAIAAIDASPYAPTRFA